jgi:hypothetical protein
MGEQDTIYETPETVMANLFDIADADSKGLAGARVMLDKGTDAVSKAREHALAGELIETVTLIHASGLPALKQIELTSQLAVQVSGVLTERARKSAMSYKDSATVARAGIITRIATKYIDGRKRVH